MVENKDIVKRCEDCKRSVPITFDYFSRARGMCEVELENNPSSNSVQKRFLAQECSYPSYFVPKAE